MLPSISSIMCFSLCHPNDGLLYICSIGLSDCRGTKTAIWYNLYFSLVLNQTYSAILPTLGFGCVKSLPHIHPFYYLLTFLWINTPFLFLMWTGSPPYIARASCRLIKFGGFSNSLQVKKQYYDLRVYILEQNTWHQASATSLSCRGSLYDQRCASSLQLSSRRRRDGSWLLKTTSCLCFQSCQAHNSTKVE